MDGIGPELRASRTSGTTTPTLRPGCRVRSSCARVCEPSGPNSVVYFAQLKARLVWVLKFNKHCSTFVLFDKKFPILD
jgi:hypothetical protein